MYNCIKFLKKKKKIGKYFFIVAKCQKSCEESVYVQEDNKNKIGYSQQ